MTPAAAAGGARGIRSVLAALTPAVLSRVHAPQAATGPAVKGIAAPQVRCRAGLGWGSRGCVANGMMGEKGRVIRHGSTNGSSGSPRSNW